MKIYFSNSAKETEKFGEKFADELKKGDIVGFSGELGSGKTTFIKGIVKKLCNTFATRMGKYLFSILTFTDSKTKMKLKQLGGKNILAKELYLLNG